MANDTLSHNELLTMIQRLDTDEQLRLLEEVAMIVRNKIKPKSTDEAKKFLNDKGVYGLAVDLISYDKKFGKIFSDFI